MSFLEKLETLINALLFKFAAFIAGKIPVPIKNKYFYFQSLWQRFLLSLKSTPQLVKNQAPLLIKKIKSSALGYNYKAALQETYKKALSQYKEKSPGKNVGKLKTILLSPFLMLGQWLQGLSAAQSMLLLTFTAGSFLSVLGIYFSGQRLAGPDKYRTPASVEEEILYERPDYYKKQTKHFTLVNVRLPVYVANVNEIKSVDIDFTATLSNRHSRMFLEKHEFHLRDHIILNMEPSIASFPLEEEGKVIIRNKLFKELNSFLKDSKIEGEVVELKIIYVLAN